MKEIKIGPSFSLDRIRQLKVRVVKILDASKSDVVEYSAFRMDRLEEWWFTPDGQFAWSGGDIVATECRDLNQLVLKLKTDELYRPVLRKIQSHICAATPPQRSVSELEWRLATRLVEGSQVISIICGDKAALRAFDDRRHTMRANAWG